MALLTAAGLLASCGARSALLDGAGPLGGVDAGHGGLPDASPREGGGGDAGARGDARGREAGSDGAPARDASGRDATRDGDSGTVDAASDAPEDTCPAASPAAPAAVFWALEGTALSMDYATTGPSGVSATVGHSQGPFSIGPAGFVPPTSSNGGYAMEAFATKVDRSGRVVFAVAFSNGSSPEVNAGTQMALGAAFDAGGNLYVAGVFTGTITFPGSPSATLQTSYSPRVPADPGPEDGFLVKLDPSGQHVWSRSFAAYGSSSLVPARVSVDFEGNLVLAGFFEGTVNLGVGDGGPGAFADDTRAPFVAKLSSAGDLLWSRAFASTTYGDLQDLAVDPAGNIYVGGSFYGELGFGPAGADPGTVLTCATDAGLGCVSPTGWLAKLTSGGTLAWTRTITPPPPQAGVTVSSGFDGVSVDDQGSLGCVGWVSRALMNRDAGTTTRVLHPFVATFDTNGTPGWTRESDANAPNAGIASTAAGTLFVATQSLTRASDAGSVTPTSFLTRLAPDGGTVWADQAAGAFFTHVAVDRCVSELVLAGGVAGTLSLPRAGGGTLVLDAGPLAPNNPASYQAMVLTGVAP